MYQAKLPGTGFCPLRFYTLHGVHPAKFYPLLALKNIIKIYFSDLYLGPRYYPAKIYPQPGKSPYGKNNTALNLLRKYLLYLENIAK